MYTAKSHSGLPSSGTTNSGLTERNEEGYRPIDAGLLTMGYRLSNSREGFDVYRRLIDPKGAANGRMMM